MDPRLTEGSRYRPSQVRRVILQTTAEGMVKEGSPYRGVIFAGLMVKDSKPKLLEYNVRFGDPECQVTAHVTRTHAQGPC